MMHSPEVLALHEENSELLRDLRELTGFNVRYAHDVTNVFISLQSQQAYGLRLPEWTRGYYPDKMLPLATKSYSYDAYTTEMRKIKAGYFLDTLFEEFKSKVDGKLTPKARKMFIDCAHDWTISNVLNALDIWQEQMPRFSALIAFELRRDNETGVYFVEIYFQNHPDKEPKLLQVPGCGAQCPLAKLLALTKHVLPDAPYAQLCKPRGNPNATRISYHR